jgi:hypothetical protein
MESLMKQQTKQTKIASILLASLITTSIFAIGCGGDTKTTNTSAKDTTTTTTAQTTTATTLKTNPTTPTTTPATTTPITTPEETSVNLIDTMTTEEIVKLNHHFDPFSLYPLLRNIKEPIDVIYLGVLEGYRRNYEQYEEFVMDYVIPKDDIEKTVKDYFDVETIDHDSVTNKDYYTTRYIRNSKLCKDGYYVVDPGPSSADINWYNVYDLRENSDGTYTAKLHYYYFDVWTVDYKLAPENRWEKVENWDLGGLKIVDNIGGEKIETYEPDTIQIIGDLTVVLTKNTVDGETSWKIKSINGWEIPKNIVIE